MPEGAQEWLGSMVEKEQKMGEWRTRHLRSREKGKGDVGVKKEKEKEGRKGEKMMNF